MKRRFRLCLSSVMCFATGACDVTRNGESVIEQPEGMNMQSTKLQGVSLQGMNMQGMNMLGFRISGAELDSVELTDLHIDHGEVVATSGMVELRGDDLVGTIFEAEVRNLSASPPATAVATFRVTAIEEEDEDFDPTETGDTYLYTLEQWVPDTSSWQPACPLDEHSERHAIPLEAIWDESGDRIESETLFTFGCTAGVIAKCYRWGYRPWVTGYGDLESIHWACTRMARSDYCGDGTSHTHDGSWINLWDNLGSPGPIQPHGLLPPLGMLFEGGWDTGGAVCLSHARWLLEDGDLIANACPDRLILPGLGEVCNSVAGVLANHSDVHLFNESYISIDL